MSPLLFFENRKKYPDFGKKCTNCAHPWVESSIQNVVSRVFRRKKSNFFPAGSFFLVFLTKSLSKCPNSQNLSCPEKFLIAHLRSDSV